MVQAFSKARCNDINYKIVPRRPRDVAMFYADVTKAKKDLDWEAKYNLDEMSEDS